MWFRLHIRCGEWQRRGEAGARGLQCCASVVEEVQALFLAGADDGSNIGEDFRVAVGAVHAAVGAGGGHAADVAFGEVIVGGNSGLFQEQQQLKTMLDQTLADALAVGMLGLRKD